MRAQGMLPARKSFPAPPRPAAIPAPGRWWSRAGRHGFRLLPLLGATLTLLFVLHGPAAALAIAREPLPPAPGEVLTVAQAAGAVTGGGTPGTPPTRAGDDDGHGAGPEARGAVQAGEEGDRPGRDGRVRAAVLGGEAGHAAGGKLRPGRAGGEGRRPVRLSPRDLRLLAQMIEAEASGEPYIGKVAVGAVILNRVESPLFPDTVEDVIFQPWQFEPVLNGWFWREPSAESWRAAREAARGVDPTGGALYFWNPAKSGYQPHLESRPPAGWIGNHRFAY